MKVHCFVAESIKDIDTQTSGARANGLTPRLGLAFASASFGILSLSTKLAEFNDITFLGASTDGEIVADGAADVVHDGTVAISLIDCASDAFQVQLFKREDQQSSFDLGQAVGNWGTAQFERPGFIIVSGGLHADGEKILQGIISVAGEGTPVFGGLAGDNHGFKSTFAFTNGKYTTDGVVALVVNTDRIELNGVATSGWTGIGAEKRITKSEGNVLYTVDDEPVLEIYKKYLSIQDCDLPQIGVEYPLMLIRDDGYSVLRSVMEVNRESGALVFAGTVPQGSRVRFSSSSGADVIEHVKRDLREFYKKVPRAEHLVLFSCMARHLALGPMIDEEILAAQEIWGVPLVGFFTYGEIGRDQSGRCDFFNETFALVTLAERERK